LPILVVVVFEFEAPALLVEPAPFPEFVADVEPPEPPVPKTMVPLTSVVITPSIVASPVVIELTPPVFLEDELWPVSACKSASFETLALLLLLIFVSF
jgi:hypothetical protein